MDVVKLVGDCVLILNPHIYCVVLQLVFESMSLRVPVQTRHVNGNVVFSDKSEFICLRRIKDIHSPFSQITEGVAVEDLLTLKYLKKIVKRHSSVREEPNQIRKMLARRFVPSTLLLKEDRELRKYDRVAKVLEAAKLTIKRQDAVHL